MIAAVFYKMLQIDFESIAWHYRIMQWILTFSATWDVKKLPTVI